MSEKMLVRNCSPTMAGLKTGNLFSCDFESVAQMREILRSYNRRLTPKGVRLLPVRFRNGRALIYVYRPTRLAQDLCDRTARDILHARGYRCDQPSACVARLARRLHDSEEFPHEIGLFLGYPPKDVHGFTTTRNAQSVCLISTANAPTCIPASGRKGKAWSA